MVRFLEILSDISFSWDQVACAFWKRYPNPYSSHVLSEDTVHREIINGTLYTRRLLVKTNRLPKWGEHFMGKRQVCIVEESIIDPKTRTISTYTRNIGYTSIMNVEEKVVYRDSPKAEGATQVVRNGWVDSQVYGFSRAIQAFGIERFRKNCAQTVLGFEHVLQNLYNVPGEKDLHVTNVQREKILETAKRAKEFARPIYASCQPVQEKEEN